MNNEQTLTKVPDYSYMNAPGFYNQGKDNFRDYSIFTLDNELKICSWNSGATKLFQYESEEIIGRHFEVIFTEEDKKEGIPEMEIQYALKDGTASDSRWHVRKDGSKLYAAGLVFPLIGVDGEMTGFVKILRGLPEKTKSEDALNKYVKDLEELNAHKDNILAILSHDLRSPLNRIISLASILKSDIDNMQPDEIKQMLGFLHNESKEELSMLDYLLEWARIKYASETFTPANINLYLYAMKVFDTLNPLASAKAIKLHNEIDEKINVFADGKMVLSIIQNIVSNAIKHSHDGGEITIGTERKEGEIIVEIKDTGIGMSKEVLQELFTPQIKSLTELRQKNEGAGIGMLLAKGLLKKNAGDIWVRSVEGEGTSFYFSLPVKGQRKGNS